MSSVIATTVDKGSVDAAILATNWGIGIEVVKRTRLVITQKGGTTDDPPKFDQDIQNK
jgi:hypothetical protein